MKNQFAEIGFWLLLLLIILSVFGCATSPDKPPQTLPTPSPDKSRQPLPPPALPGQEKTKGKDPLSEVAERYRLKARENEKIGDLPRALRAWEIVKGILPGDEEAGGKTLKLKKQIPAIADQHFQKGLVLFRSHSYTLARKEFLFVLYLKPDHPEAIHYLKHKLAGEDFLLYPVKKGDTIRGVAAKFYEDPQKDFLIARFNDLKVDSQLEPPRVLRLPVLDSPSAKRPPLSPPTAVDLAPEMVLDFQDDLGKTKEAYRRGNYRESAALAEKIVVSEPENREYRELMNASYYELGTQLGREKKYDEALKAFHRVDSGYKDRDTQLIQNRKQLAEVHYLRGVKFFLEEEIESAIQEWEATLTLEPAHANAKKDIQNGRNLLQNLKKIK